MVSPLMNIQDFIAWFDEKLSLLQHHKTAGHFSENGIPFLCSLFFFSLKQAAIFVLNLTAAFSHSQGQRSINVDREGGGKGFSGSSSFEMEANCSTVHFKPSFLHQQRHRQTSLCNKFRNHLLQQIGNLHFHLTLCKPPPGKQLYKIRRDRSLRAHRVKSSRKRDKMLSSQLGAASKGSFHFLRTRKQTVGLNNWNKKTEIDYSRRRCCLFFPLGLIAWLLRSTLQSLRQVHLQVFSLFHIAQRDCRP